ncbi:DUF6620 family protein [Sphingobacterium spiritivorum]|uniref:DUF6620 family protein n=1 Tax=Sphingobacterium spiritivorum TaxID=258 RepID=UPI001F30EC38|nr:DUF6620 family protein [Sphingobacterium spiritivorum]
MNLDPQTLHGMHYTEDQFDAELEKRFQEHVDSSDGDWDKSDRHSYRRHLLRQIYQEWNPETDTDDFINFEMANSMKYSGVATAGYTKEDHDNPLLQPIHGISLKDYTALVANLGSIDPKTLFNAFGIDETIFEELNILWPKRMQEDETFTITTLYGQYFMEIGNHPVILDLHNKSNTAPAGTNNNLDRLKSDPYFYEELNAARTAAYEYGIDGAQWIEDNFGIGLIDFQSVAMQWMTKRNQNFNTAEITEMMDYHEIKYEEYKAKFAGEQGGNIGDDIDF